MSDDQTATPRRRRWLLPAIVYPVLAANLVALWVKRGAFVGGWELFGGEQLIKLSNDNGGRDNVSVVLVRVADAFPAEGGLMSKFRGLFGS
jgi:hypothetical protein